MSVERFTLDSNILVYTFDTADRRRQSLSIEIVRRALRQDCHLTLQSLGEFFSVVTRKHGAGRAVAARAVENWLAAFPQIAATPRCLRAALGLVVEGRASYWDALLVATAAGGGCTAMISEDLADGAVLHGVRIVHPFGPAGLTEAAIRLVSRG